MPWIEVMEAQASCDRFGRNVRTRVFKVWGDSLDHIREDQSEVLAGIDGDANGNGANNAPLPEVGSLFEGLGLDHYTFVRNGNVILAIAHYTNDFLVPPIDFDYRTVEVSIPYGYKVGTKLSSGTTLYDWKYSSFTFEEPRLFISQRVRLPRDVFVAQAKAVSDQNGRIHPLKLGSMSAPTVFGLFRVANTQFITPQMAEITYQWMIDQGTTFIEIPSTITGQNGDNFEYLFPIQNKTSEFYQDKKFCRPPFSVIVTVPGKRGSQTADPTNPIFVPVLTHQREYLEPGSTLGPNNPSPEPADYSGALNLPGFDARAFVVSWESGGGGG